MSALYGTPATRAGRPMHAPLQCRFNKTPGHQITTTTLLALPALLLTLSHAVAKDEPAGVRRVQLLDYADCIELHNPSTRAVIGWRVGGRVLSYQLKGREALFLDPAERDWRTSKSKLVTAGRFDIGPEYLIPKRDALWSGEWSAEIIGARAVRLVSASDSNTGVRLIREFKLDANTSRLNCRQIIENTSDKILHWCHWSRTFAKHGGSAIVPLDEHGKFPNGYVMYEGRGLINARPEDPNIIRVGDFLVVKGVPKFPKLGFDSMAGWLAYQTPDDLLFVKRFATYPDRAYNEVAGLTISVWYPEASKVRAVELEPIGPKNNIPPRGRAEFTEHWELSIRNHEKAFDIHELEQLATRLKGLPPTAR